MNSNAIAQTRRAALAVSLLGCLLVVYGLVKTMQYYTRPAPVNAARVGERQQALVEQKAVELEQTTRYGWVDQTRGIVRMPVTNAMELTLLEYRDPATARTNLLTRLEQATAPLAPPPAPVNPFE